MLSKRVTFLITSLSLLLIFAASIYAIPPSPEAIEKWKAEGTLEQKLIKWRKVDKLDSYLANAGLFDAKSFRTKTAQADVVDTGYVVVALVDFIDNPASEEAWEFDSLLFSVQGEGGYNNPTGSWTDFYLENSYGKYYVKGIVSGWHRMSQPYTYYVGDGPDDTGVRANILATEAARATDADVDYSQLTNNGTFLGFVVVHAGAGAEAGASPAIWSHKGNFSEAVYLDEVSLYGYTMNPEKYGSAISTMGVFAHEYGHALGLPDLYDTEYNQGSSGLGAWSMMAGGSWNGFDRGGDTPAHFDAWCKATLGYVEVIPLRWNHPTDLTPPTSIIQAPIPQAESEPVVYKLWNDADDMYGEYWLVENRQQVGFDAALPGNGLCIYHVDNFENTNTNPGKYRVGLEQADGLEGLAFGGSRGDSGDPYPGSTNNRNFNDITTPNSRNHLDQQTQIGVWNISDSDSLMFADLEAGFTHPWPVFSPVNPIQFNDAAPGGNGNGVLDPGETIEFFCRLTNTMAQSYDAWVNLTVDHPDITVSPTWVSLTPFFNPTKLDGFENSVPLKFTIPEGIDPMNVTFTLKLISDNIPNGQTESHYTSTWAIEQVLGQPKVMIIDNDGGQDWDLTYREAINDLGYAWGRWDHTTRGAPTADDLIPYEIVLYMSGHPSTGGTVDLDDATAFGGYLQSGGQLAIVSATAAKQFNTASPGFLPSFMYAQYVSSGAFGYNIEGIAGSGLGDGFSFEYDGAFSFSGAHDKIAAVAPAVETHNISFYGSLAGACGTAYSNQSYKAIMLTTPLEFYRNNLAGMNSPTDMVEAIINYFDGIITDVVEIENGTLPTGFSLSQNYPNPFNPSTSISYTVPASDNGQAVDTKLEVFNVLGQTVETLVDGPRLPGSYTVVWDGRDLRGERMASGIYLYRLTSGSVTDTKKMVLVK